MSLVLGIDTSADVRVGLARLEGPGDGGGEGEVLARAAVTDTRQHVEQLAVLIDQVLASADVTVAELDAVCVGLGPGPFTGLRVGIAAAQVLAGVRRLPLHGVCSLDVVAATAMREPGFSAPQGFLAVSDARRKELYWARYAPAGARVDGPRVGPPVDLPALPVVGPGAGLVDDRATGTVDHVDAGLMAALAWRLPDAGVEPLYLRTPDAVEPTRRKSVLTNRLRKKR